jgi:hypothetical protein
MLSAKLVELVESSWKDVASRVVGAIRENPELTNLAKKSDFELREWCQGIVEHLGYYLGSAEKSEIERRFQKLGRVRFDEQIPLHEAVLRFQILHEKILGFIREQGFTMTALQLYSEEELEHRMRHFFDTAVYQVVRGYEDQLRRYYRLAS